MSAAAYVERTKDNRERALWLAVIQQHLIDAVSQGKDRHARRVRAEAREWLTVPNAGFAEVCALLDLEPSHVRKRAVAIIEAADSGQPSIMKEPPKPSVPRSPAKTVTFNGETLTIDQWAKRTGLSVGRLSYRLEAGYSPEIILSPDPLPKGGPRARRALGRAAPTVIPSPGVGQNFGQTHRDRRGSVAQDRA